MLLLNRKTDEIQPYLSLNIFKVPWRLGKSWNAMAIGIILAAASAGLLLLFSCSTFMVSVVSTHARSETCHFPAVFNFGDSNSDTGNVAAAFTSLTFPYGETFGGKLSGRNSDGRLIIDFLTDEIGIPYLSAYLNFLASNFKHGANFAASGATLQHADKNLYAKGFNPLSLDVQIAQFEHFQAMVNVLYDQALQSLPFPENLSHALYTLDSGQNDLHYMLTSMTAEQAQSLIPKIIDQFSSNIQRLYELGARVFWIHNTGPIGCLPVMVVNYPPDAGNADQIGCVKSFNNVAQDFNQQLKKSVSILRDNLHNATLVYVDIYSVKYSLITNAKKYGFHPPGEYCCGKPGVVNCWDKGIVNGSVCIDPAKYISWDGIHYTEAANKLVANLIKDGAFSEPPLPIFKACGFYE